MSLRRMILLLGAAFSVAQNDLQRTALKALFDLTVPVADLTTAERDTLATLFEGCDASTNVLSPILDDVVATATNCSKVVMEKTTDSIFSTSDKTRMTHCTTDAQTLLTKHGGVNLLSVPALTAANKATLKSCANGDGSTYGDALAVLVQRYTPCKLTITNAEKAIMDKIVPASPSTDAENGNQVAVRNICISMDGFETMNGLVADVAANTIKTFVNGLHIFSTNNERRR